MEEEFILAAPESHSPSSINNTGLPSIQQDQTNDIRKERVGHTHTSGNSFLPEISIENGYCFSPLGSGIGYE